jgi:hypothetical protein
MHMMFGNTYKYNYSLVKPTSDPLLNFEDENIKAKFTITSDEIGFVLQNKRTDPIRINWDDASLVLDGKVEKVMHKGVKYTERNNSMPATTIPGSATLDDLVLPTSNVSLNTISSISWSTQPLFPAMDYNNSHNKEMIKSNAGKEFTLYLPVKDVNGKEFGYSFVFHIDGVTCMDCKEVSENSKGNKGSKSK